MKNQNFIIAVQLTLTFASLICSVFCFRLIKSWKKRANNYLVVAEQLERDIKVLSCNLEASVERESVYLKKLSTLNNKTEPKFTLQPSTYKPKSNMTEKRHRVLALAKYGQDVDTIANTLGLPHGEVELIVNLNSVA
jgi:hypothetical protein